MHPRGVENSLLEPQVGHTAGLAPGPFGLAARTRVRVKGNVDPLKVGEVDVHGT